MSSRRVTGAAVVDVGLAVCSADAAREGQHLAVVVDVELEHVGDALPDEYATRRDRYFDDHCSFTLPAVVRRGPVVLTVSTGGHSPALAVWLKERLGAEIGPEYEVLADLLSQQRDAVQAAGRSTESIDWRKALDSDMLDLIRSGHVQQAKERLQACLSSSSD